MKKYLIYIGLIVVGLLFGWILFGESTTNEVAHQHDDKKQSNQMWTCSMHPQIMQPEAGDCPICGMDLIPAETSAEGLAADQFKLTKNAMALANIQTTIVGMDDMDENGIKLSGKIVENEDLNTVQISYFSGRIEKLNVSSTGEKVRKGQLLATIYSPELFAAQQELLTASSMKDSQPALYKAVRNKLKLWKLSDSQINQIEASGEVKENFPVYATVSGTVLEKLVEQGQTIKQGQPLFKIANLNSLWANFDVFENQIDLFKVGQEVIVSTNAYPNKKFTTKVSFIDPILDAKTRIVKMRVVLKNTNNLFKPGMFVEGIITVGKSGLEQVVMIPSSAILWTGKRSVVYLKLNADTPIFEMREVTIGNKIGENYEVLSGLESGDEVVTNGTFTVDAAAQLQGKKSMMNKRGGKTSTGHEGHAGMGDAKMASNEDHSEMSTKLKVSSKFQNQLKEVFDAYIVLKDALVTDNYEVSKSAVNAFALNLSKVDMKLLTTKEAHQKWMSIEKEIKISANSIINDVDIKGQRNNFISLSSNLISAVKVFGINQNGYVLFCPMANNDNGAYWLSLEKEIRNPYFGSAMLKCGEVTEELEN